MYFLINIKFWVWSDFNQTKHLNDRYFSNIQMTTLNRPKSTLDQTCIDNNEKTRHIKTKENCLRFLFDLNLTRKVFLDVL